MVIHASLGGILAAIADLNPIMDAQLAATAMENAVFDFSEADEITTIDQIDPIGEEPKPV